MNENTKQSANTLLEEAAKQLECALVAFHRASFLADEIIPHNGLTVEIAADDWVPCTQELWRAWTGRRKIWSLEYHGPLFNIASDDFVPFIGKRICACAICQEHVAYTLKPN